MKSHLPINEKHAPRSILGRVAAFAFLLFVWGQYAPLLASDPLYPVGIVGVGANTAAIVHKGSKTIDTYTLEPFIKKNSLILNDAPTGIAQREGRLYVTTYGISGTLCIVEGDTVVRRIEVGHSPVSPVVSANGARVYVLNQFTHRVSEVDVAKGKVTRTAQVLREPKGAVLSQDGKYLFVTNFLPAQRADVDFVSAEVSVINTTTFAVEKSIKLASGSNALRGIALSADGLYLFVSHNLGRFTVPTSQLQQGWMNTSAVSVIDARNHTYLGTVVLDDPDRGAAGIWGIHATPTSIVVTHSGTHDVSVIDYRRFMDKLLAFKGDVSALSYDLRFCYGIRRRIPLEGNGPRDFLLRENKVYIPTYFSDTLNVLSLTDGALQAYPLSTERTETLAQRGERIFNDAQYCFQHWQSCNGCHPGDARTDGMNWDLMNDGIGNPKNCKSLLFSIQTPPSMISAIRVSAQLANRKGFTHIQFFDIPEEAATWVDAYTQSLTPVPSPYLVNGALSPLAERGRKVYQRLRCDECHSGIYYTDMKTHRIGEQVEFEQGWDTPTLREVWRTAPYLFDGRAATMREVFEVYKHGINQKISSKELTELVEYVNSL